MFKTEPNRTCYITCVMLYNISSKQNITCVMLYNKKEHVLVSYYIRVVMLYIRHMFKIEQNRTCYETCHVMLYNMCRQVMLYNMCHVVLYNMSCYVI